MKIPDGDSKADRFKRLAFVEDIKTKCLVSREDRKELYNSWRLYYLYGSDGSYENEDRDTGLGPPPGNKIYPHIDQLTSFMYAQETTRFSVEPGVSAPKELLTNMPILGRLVNDEWHDSNTDLVYGQGLIWSFVYGSTFVKPIWRRNQIYPYVVLPHNFGVYREDIAQLSRQEAYIHCYSITKTQLRRDLEDHPKRSEILDQITARAEIPQDHSTGMDRILLSSQDPLTSGSGSGVIDWMSTISNQYQPRVAEEMIDMYDLYVYDDALSDFRVFTVADPFVVIYDRPHNVLFLSHEDPVIQICPNPAPDYFWGHSEVERLVPLQKWRNQCMAQIEHLQDLQAHAPSTSSGFPGDLAEIQYVLDTPSGFLNQPDPAGVGGTVKADRIKVELPADLYQRIDRIDDMFEEVSGITNVMQGKGESGVRSSGHANQLARLGSSRAKKRALIVEDSLEALATLYLKILQKYDDKRLIDAKGVPFLAEQVGKNMVVKVDAHSNSPIFVEDQTQIAFELFKVKAITRERLLDLVQVPMRELLKQELKEQIEPAEAKAAQEEKALELRKIEQHGRKAA